VLHSSWGALRGQLANRDAEAELDGEKSKDKDAAKEGKDAAKEGKEATKDGKEGKEKEKEKEKDTAAADKAGKKKK